MPQNIATTPQIDRLVDRWIAEGRFANRSEAFRAVFDSDRDLLSLGKPFGLAVVTPAELVKRIGQ